MRAELSSSKCNAICRLATSTADLVAFVIMTRCDKHEQKTRVIKSNTAVVEKMCCE